MKYKILILLFFLIINHSLKGQNTGMSAPEFIVIGIIELKEPILIYTLNKDKKSVECTGFVTEKKNLEQISRKKEVLKYSIFDTNSYAILHSSHFVYDYLLPAVDENVGVLLKKTYPNEVLTNIKMLSDTNRYSYYIHKKEIKYFHIMNQKFLAVLLRVSIYNRYIPLGGGCLYFRNEKTYEGLYIKVLIPLLEN